MKSKILTLLNSLRAKALTSSGEKKIVDGFNIKVKEAGGIEKIVDKLKVMYAYFRDKDTSSMKKGLVGAALLYFLLPTDVVMDFIPVVGYIDDVTAAMFVWNMLSKELDDYREKADRQMIDIKN
ncbi:DUF1232 domain-containing protein [Hazenella sp. IB182357]|uniref:DUF1232 domain-containing protein n=1 Tax=Polycladospora coralii TaxID=2771432 RepID=A0A926N6Z7_9BACL|nr:YkvA family protein [Polycladospora coralii]MBD1370971.1 DUF1232 domain-containing protein [Polycladospora coralii]MBS7529910.1 DUF1232 domain-containing protein [Polycladospora coralii]